MEALADSICLRIDLQRRPIARVTRAKLMKMARQYEAEEIHAVRMEQGASNWLGFLQQRAAQGDETALAVLRSRNEEVAPETPVVPMQIRAVFLANKTEVLENSKLSGRAKNRLVSVALMESQVSGVTFKVTTYGNIVYTLPNGGKICDTGKRISFSPDARAAALAYMAAKWNVKQRSVDRATGDTVYTLTSGQKIYDRKGGHVLSGPPCNRRFTVSGHGAKGWGGALIEVKLLGGDQVGQQNNFLNFQEMVNLVGSTKKGSHAERASAAYRVRPLPLGTNPRALSKFF